MKFYDLYLHGTTVFMGFQMLINGIDGAIGFFNQA